MWRKEAVHKRSTVLKSVLPASVIMTLACNQSQQLRLFPLQITSIYSCDASVVSHLPNGQ